MNFMRKNKCSLIDLFLKQKKSKRKLIFHINRIFLNNKYIFLDFISCFLWVKKSILLRKNVFLLKLALIGPFYL